MLDFHTNNTNNTIFNAAAQTHLLTHIVICLLLNLQDLQNLLPDYPFIK